MRRRLRRSPTAVVPPARTQPRGPLTQPYSSPQQLYSLNASRCPHTQRQLPRVYSTLLVNVKRVVRRHLSLVKMLYTLGLLSMTASSLAKNLTPTAEGAAVGKTSGRGLARCFPDRYADGLWVASNATLSYRMALETWQYSMCDRSRQNHRSALEAQSAGVADVLLPTRSDPYEWKPRDGSCALPRLDTATVCALLRGRRIMFVGDSVIMSVFYSIALALQAKTSMDGKGIHRRAIVHCGNNATVEFSAVRNDHLQLSGDPRPIWVTGYTPSGNWLLHEPDFTVMASGLHDVTRGG